MAPNRHMEHTHIHTQHAHTRTLYMYRCLRNMIYLLTQFLSALGKPVDADQEMLAVGLCNLAGSFVGSMPTSGSFSRSSVNAASGVATPLGGVYTGALVMLALAAFMPACAYIPRSYFF